MLLVKVQCPKVRDTLCSYKIYCGIWLSDVIARITCKVTFIEANKKLMREDAEVGNLAKTLFKNPAFVLESEKLGYMNATESAKRMLQRGVDVADIADYLDLPLERVKRIMRELGKKAGSEQETAALP